MNFRKLIVAGAAVAALMGVPAQASVVDNPQFRVLGLVIVWGSDGSVAPDGTLSSAPVVSDFIINDAVGNGDTDLIAGEVHAVVTGTLSAAPSGASDATFEIAGAEGVTGVLDASAANFSPFTLNAGTDVQVGSDLVHESSFYVASNTLFNIEAEAVEVTPANDGFELSDIGFDLSVTVTGTDDGFAFGGNAQDPHSQGTGTQTNIQTLADLETLSDVYRGDQRTAETAGSIVDQSVRFDAEYTLAGQSGTGYDLSDGAGEIEARVTYTVYVP